MTTSCAKRSASSSLEKTNRELMIVITPIEVAILMLPLDRPLRINNRTIVLVDDLALSCLNETLSERLIKIASTDPDISLYVEQLSVDALSELHPGLPLYGFWQTLIASGLIPQEPGLYQALTDSSPHAGRYLLREPGHVYSGQVIGDRPLDVFTADGDPITPTLIDVHPDILRLPPQPIQDSAPPTGQAQPQPHARPDINGPVRAWLRLRRGPLPTAFSVIITPNKCSRPRPCNNKTNNCNKSWPAWRPAGASNRLISPSVWTSC